MSKKRADYKNLYELIEKSYVQFKDCTLYRFKRTKDEEVKVSYGEFYHYVRKLTLALNANPDRRTNN